jgi:hypothetical protein
LAQGSIKFGFDPEQLRNYIFRLRSELDSMDQSELSFKIVNVARDVGAPSSTGIYYYSLVDEGRGPVSAKPGVVTVKGGKSGNKEVLRKLIFKLSPGGRKIYADVVGPAAGKHLTAAIQREVNHQMPQLIEKQLRGGYTGGLPSKTSIRSILNNIKEDVLNICRDVTRQLVSGHQTRETRYGNSSAVSLEEGFRIG